MSIYLSAVKVIFSSMLAFFEIQYQSLLYKCSEKFLFLMKVRWILPFIGNFGLYRVGKGSDIFPLLGNMSRKGCHRFPTCPIRASFIFL